MRYHKGMKQKLTTGLLALALVAALSAPVVSYAQSEGSNFGRIISLVRIIVNADISTDTKALLLNLVLDQLDDSDEVANDDSNDDELEDDDDEPRMPEARGVSVIDTSDRSSDGERAEFELTFSLRSFGEDIYVDQDLETSFEFEILDNDDSVVMTHDDLGGSNLSGILTSDARDEGDYYVIYEDDNEQFEVRVVFDPDTSDFYRLRLTELNFNYEPDSPEFDYSFNDRDFTSNPLYVSGN